MNGGEGVGWGVGCVAARGVRYSLPMRRLRAETVRRARRLRKRPTEAERRLWYHIRDRRLDGWRFRREHPIERYYADFACVEAGLVVELDGGQHDEQRGYDAQRDARLGELGFRVLRFSNDEVFDNLEGVLTTIQQALQE